MASSNFNSNMVKAEAWGAMSDRTRVEYLREQRAQDAYKTELCKEFARSGGTHCSFGDRCRFAHGITELRVRKRHPRYKTKLCKNYAETGYCKYQHRCDYIHRSPSRGPTSQQKPPSLFGPVNNNVGGFDPGAPFLAMHPTHHPSMLTVTTPTFVGSPMTFAVLNHFSQHQTVMTPCSPLPQPSNSNVFVFPSPTVPTPTPPTILHQAQHPAPMPLSPQAHLQEYFHLMDSVNGLCLKSPTIRNGQIKPDLNNNNNKFHFIYPPVNPWLAPPPKLKDWHSPFTNVGPNGLSSVIVGKDQLRIPQPLFTQSCEASIGVAKLNG